MIGKILGLNKKNDQGTILGKDENRYTFVKDEIAEEITPEKNMCVEFVPSKDNKATNIHKCERYIKDTPNLLLGVVTIAITLVFGCIGTFISRYLFAKLPLKEVLFPTTIHFILSLIFFIPFIGMIFYIFTTLYFTVKNYKIIINSEL